MEMMNLLGLPDPAPTVARMAQLGVLAVVLPEASPETLAQLVAQEKVEGVAPDALRRLAALLPANVPLAEQVASRFRLSGAQKKRLATAAARDGQVGDARALAYQLGMDGAMDRVLLCNGTIRDLRDWTIPVFPLKVGISWRGASPQARVSRNCAHGRTALGCRRFSRCRAGRCLVERSAEYRSAIRRRNDHCPRTNGWKRCHRSIDRGGLGLWAQVGDLVATQPLLKYSLICAGILILGNLLRYRVPLLGGLLRFIGNLGLIVALIMVFLGFVDLRQFGINTPLPKAITQYARPKG
jgi:hypothetical protein